MKIEAIWRYPVKGLNGEYLETAALRPGEGLAGDRAFAVARPGTDFDESVPEHRRKTEFIVLMTHEKLAELTCRYDPDNGCLRIHKAGQPFAEGNLRNAAGRESLGRLLAAHAGFDPPDGARILHAPGHMFSDVATKCLSLINLASVAALAERMGRDLDPIRFRGNVTVTGLPAWAELDWPAGQVLNIGQAQLEMIAPIKRCPATDVNPATAARDTNIPASLVREFGHPHMGVYARVIAGGTISPGDRIVTASNTGPG